MTRLDRTVMMILVFSLSLVIISYAQQTDTDAARTIREVWVIKSIYHTQNVQGPSPAEQKRLIGSEIAYGAGSLRSCGRSVPIRSMKIDRVGAEDFLADTHVRFNEVDIQAKSLMEVVINNRQAGSCFQAFPLPGQDVFLKGENEILINFEGVFYRATRKK